MPYRLFAHFCAALSASFFVFLSVPSIAADGEGATRQPIINHAIVGAPVAEVWEAWTKSEELTKFVGRGAEIDPRPRGLFRVVFFPERVSPVDRGNDGLILSLEPQRMLTFTWMTPLNMKGLRGNSTVVSLHFTPLDATTTRVDLLNTGYGQGEEWQAAYDYNVKGWDRILAALEYRFKIGKAIDREAELEKMRTTGRMSYWRTK
jgi:uncharacterized protein YndB with AHSA1/START domain